MQNDEEELLPRVSGGYDMKEDEEEIRRRRQEEESAMWIRGSPIESYVIFIKKNLHAVVATSLFFVMFKTFFLLAFAVCFGWREWFFMFESSIFAIVAATLYLEILHVVRCVFIELLLFEREKRTHPTIYYYTGMGEISLGLRWCPEHTDGKSHERAALCHDSIVFLCSDVLSHER